MNLKLTFSSIPTFSYMEQSENVRNVQKLLLELGYDIGNSKADGIFGNATKRALNNFIQSGKIKAGGSIGEITLQTLRDGEVIPTGFKPLSWESTDTSRANWSKFVFETIEKLYDTYFLLCEDMTTLRADYNSLNRSQKINVWGELISAIAYYESGWNPTSRMVETAMHTDPITGHQVASEGLLQLSYQDKPSYRDKVEIQCKFNWDADKELFTKNPKDPNITILNPYYNIEFGIGILAYQIKTYKKIILTKNVYWSVIQEGGKYQKINKIIGYVEKLKF